MQHLLYKFATGCSNTNVCNHSSCSACTITSADVSICNDGGNTLITGTVTANGNWLLTLSNGATATGTGNGSFSIAVSPVISTLYTIASLDDENCSALPGGLSGSTFVTVYEPVSIVTQPAPSQTICSSFPVSFSVSATGTGLNYQWYLGATPLTDNANISGSNTAVLTIAQAALADAGTYRVEISATAPCTAVFR
jgi:hypothetical protein